MAADVFGTRVNLDFPASTPLGDGWAWTAEIVDYDFARMLTYTFRLDLHRNGTMAKTATVTTGDFHWVEDDNALRGAVAAELDRLARAMVDELEAKPK